MHSPIPGRGALRIKSDPQSDLFRTHFLFDHDLGSASTMPARRRQRGFHPLINFGLAFAVLAGMTGGAYGIAQLIGWLPVTPIKKVSPSRTGMMPVPKSLVDLKAFEAVTREDIYDLQKGDDSYFWFSKERVARNPDWIVNVEEIVGRVMARDKRPEFVFTEKDFLPRGSRTGLAGGVPEGKQGFFIRADQADGLRLLKMGDRFDLLASLPEESGGAAEYGLLMGGIKALGKKPIPLSGVRLLVQGGTVVALTDGRAMTTQGGMAFSSPSTAATNRSRTTAAAGGSGGGEQLAIAIDPEEVVPLTQALGAGLRIHAVARSGQTTEIKKEPDELAGLIPFPATAVPLKAYARITANDLSDPSSQELRQYYFRPEAISPQWVRAVDQLIGRIVRRDVEAGYIFSESDLLPAEAAPGIAGVIPAGRMALSVPRSRVTGLEHLVPGNHCDLLAATPLNFSQDWGGGLPMADLPSLPLAERAVNQVLAVDAVVVDSRESVVILAVTPAEVAALTKALALETAIYSLAKPTRLIPSGTATESAESLPTALLSDEDPRAKFSVTESIIGGKRTISVYRKPTTKTP